MLPDEKPSAELCKAMKTKNIVTPPQAGAREYVVPLLRAVMVGDEELDIVSVSINGIACQIDPPVRILPGDKVYFRDLPALPPEGGQTK
jgi:hypothetical protein